MAHNGLRLCVRAGLEAQTFSLATKLIKSTNVQFTTSARLTQNRCYGQVCLSDCPQDSQTTNLKPFSYFPFGLGAGGLLPRPPPEGFPVVLGPFGGLVVVFAIALNL